MGTVGKKEGTIFQCAWRSVRSAGPVEVEEYDCGDRPAVSVGHGDGLVESLPDHLWSRCGGVSAGLGLGNQSSSTF